MVNNNWERKMIPEVRVVVLSTIRDLMAVGDSYAHEAAEEISQALFGAMPYQLREFQEGCEIPRTEKDFSAVLLGRSGGRKGGKKRAEILSPERRIEIAVKAARTRWNKD